MKSARWSTFAAHGLTMGSFVLLCIFFSHIYSIFLEWSLPLCCIFFYFLLIARMFAHSVVYNVKFNIWEREREGSYTANSFYVFFLNRKCNASKYPKNSWRVKSSEICVLFLCYSIRFYVYFYTFFYSCLSIFLHWIVHHQYVKALYKDFRFQWKKNIF